MPRNERLRHHRIHRNWRQQDVADELEVSLATVQRWERGIQEPSAYYRAKLCALLGLSAQELGLLEAAPVHEIAQQAAPPAAPIPTSPGATTCWSSNTRKGEPISLSASARWL